MPASCQSCATPLPQVRGGDHDKRQVFDLPEPRPLVVTEHRAHRCRCAACGAVTKASFPEGVSAPVQSGVRISAIVVYLSAFQFVPLDRLASLMLDLFGVTLSRASIETMSRRAGTRLLDFAEGVRQLILAAPIKHLDETGFRIVKTLRWLHIAATVCLTYYRIGSDRGDMLRGAGGIVVHDHWGSYFKMPGVEHALCNAHHLRELQSLIELQSPPLVMLSQEIAAAKSKNCPGRRADYCFVVAAAWMITAGHRARRWRPFEDKSEDGRLGPRTTNQALLGGSAFDVMVHGPIEGRVCG